MSDKTGSHRVCFLTTSFPRYEGDDAGIFVKRLVAALSELRCFGSVIAPLDQDEPSHEHFLSFHVVRYRYGVWRRGQLAFGEGIVPKLRSRPLLALQIPMLIAAMTLAAARESRQSPFEVLIANWLGTAPAAWLYRRLRGTPYIIALRGEDMRLLRKPALGWLMRMFLSDAHAIVSVNESFLTEVKDRCHIAPQKLHCIPNGVYSRHPSLSELSQFMMQQGLSEEKKYLLFIGSVIPRKGIELLLEALSCLPLSDFSLIICGRTAEQAYFRRLQQRMSQLDLSDRVVFTGAVAPHDIPLYLAAARYYVTASEFEGRPNALLEALAARKVCVASDIAAHREIVVHAHNGFLFARDTPAQLAECIRAIESDDAARERIQAHAERTARGWSWGKAAHAYKQLMP